MPLQQPCMRVFPLLTPLAGLGVIPPVVSPPARQRRTVHTFGAHIPLHSHHSVSPPAVPPHQPCMSMYPPPPLTLQAHGQLCIVSHSAHVYTYSSTHTVLTLLMHASVRPDVGITTAEGGSHERAPVSPHKGIMNSMCGPEGAAHQLRDSNTGGPVRLPTNLTALQHLSRMRLINECDVTSVKFGVTPRLFGLSV